MCYKMKLPKAVLDECARWHWAEKQAQSIVPARICPLGRKCEVCDRKEGVDDVGGMVLCLECQTARIDFAEEFGVMPCGQCLIEWESCGDCKRKRHEDAKADAADAKRR